MQQPRRSHIGKFDPNGIFKQTFVSHIPGCIHNFSWYFTLKHLYDFKIDLLRLPVKLDAVPCGNVNTITQLVNLVRKGTHIVYCLYVRRDN